MTTAKIAVTQKVQGIQRFFLLLTVKDRIVYTERGNYANVFWRFDVTQFFEVLFFIKKSHRVAREFDS